MRKPKKTFFFEKFHLIFVSKTLEGLNAIHESHKIHRDIKSDNILINSDGQVKIGKRTST